MSPSTTRPNTTPPACAHVEDWLKKRGVAYKGPMATPLDLINERKSQTNQARPEAIVQEVVDRYAVAMKAGDSFPPIVGYIVAGKVVVIDGNHRVAAAKKAGYTHIVMFGVAPETSTELITLLTVEANSKHGLPTDTKWRVEQALHLFDIGISQDLACEAAGIKVQQLKDRIAVRKADERARKLGVTQFAILAPAARQALGTLKDDAVMVVASNCVIDNELSVTDARNLIRDVKAKGSESERLKVVTDFDEKRRMERAAKAVVGKRQRTSNAKLSLTTAIGKVLAFDIGATGRIFGTSFERAEMDRRIDECLEHLVAIQDEIRRLAKEDRDAAAS